MGLPYKVLRSLLFAYGDLCGDQEKAHVLAMHGVDALCHSRRFMRTFGWLFRDERIDLRCKVGGITFSNPFGIAAGLIKHPRRLPFFVALGAGFQTIGTFTPQSQMGNPHPRLFRSTRDHSLLNRLKFPNPGAEEAVIELQHVDLGDYPLIASISASSSALESGDEGRIIDEYAAVFASLYPHVAAIEVNVSSPNAEGVRAFMQRSKLGRLLSMLRAIEHSIESHHAKKMLLVKGTMDLVPEDQTIITAPNAVIDLIEICAEYECGITWGNTTSQKKWRPPALMGKGEGGVSGQPLYLHTIFGCEFIRETQASRGLQHLPLIATGGIWGAWEALQALRAGADLFGQLTPIIFEGPLHFRREKREMRRHLPKSGLHLRQSGKPLSQAA